VKLGGRLADIKGFAIGPCAGAFSPLEESEALARFP